MRIQSVVLEYHCDISILWLYVVHDLIVNLELTRRNFLQTCDHTKSSRLTTTRRSYEDYKFLIFYFKVEILYSLKSVWISL